MRQPVFNKIQCFYLVHVGQQPGPQDIKCNRPKVKNNSEIRSRETWKRPKWTTMNEFQGKMIFVINMNPLFLETSKEAYILDIPNLYLSKPNIQYCIYNKLLIDFYKLLIMWLIKHYLIYRAIDWHHNTWIMKIYFWTKKHNLPGSWVFTDFHVCCFGKG